jgi:hypothetical protein
MANFSSTQPPRQRGKASSLQHGLTKGEKGNGFTQRQLDIWREMDVDPLHSGPDDYTDPAYVTAMYL